MVPRKTPKLLPASILTANSMSSDTRASSFATELDTEISASSLDEALTHSLAARWDAVKRTGSGRHWLLASHGQESSRIVQSWPGAALPGNVSSPRPPPI